jgi:hypothetical protein
MDALNIAVLRGICASYFESHVAPAVAEVRGIQAELAAELQNQSARTRLEPCFEGHPTRAQFESLAAKIELKANAEDVPTILQFSKLVAQVDQAASRSNLEELAAALETRANSAEKLAAARAEELALELDRLRDISDAIENKANAGDVPTIVQFERLVATVERKAKQQHELSMAVGRKVDAELAPTMAQLEDLLSDVPSIEDMQALTDTLARKADSEEVHGLLARSLEELSAAVERKANADQVPNLAQFEQLSAGVWSTMQCQPMVYWVPSQMVAVAEDSCQNQAWTPQTSEGLDTPPRLWSEVSQSS